MTYLVAINEEVSSLKIVMDGRRDGSLRSRTFGPSMMVGCLIEKWYQINEDGAKRTSWNEVTPIIAIQ